MQKHHYGNLQEERETEMSDYNQNIPMGQPIHPYAHPNQYNQHNYHLPPPPPMHFPHPQQFVHPPPPPIMIQNPSPVSINTYNNPAPLACPCCKQTVMSVMNLESGNTTYMWCAFIGCCVSPLLCCVPFLMDSCLDKSHYCPNCGYNILRKHQKCCEFIGC